jgi:DNA polymerase I
MRDDNSVFSSLQSVTGATYTNASYNRDLIDVYLLRKARAKGVRLPTGGPPEEYKYLGAKVFQSASGMSHNVTYIDVGSMYPSQLMSMNASLETIVGTKEDLLESQYSQDDCVWGYIDPRPVKHLSKGEPWRQYTNGEYKMIYDPHAPAVKWTCDERDGPQYEKLYFLNHDTQKGFLTECVDELIDLKNRYRGTSLYGSTKRVTNCFTPDTEVMTPNGVVNIRDLEVDDVVYSINPDTMEVEEKPVTKTWEYPDYDGELVDIQTQHTDLRVTPNHRILCNSVLWGNDVDEYEFNEAGELLNRGQFHLPRDFEYSSHGSSGAIDLADYIPSGGFIVHDDEIEYKTGRKAYNRYISERNAAKLIGWYVSEGSLTDYSEHEANGDELRVTITQTEKTGYRDEILSFLDDIGVTYYDSDYKNISVWDRPIGYFCKRCGRGSENKKLPDIVWSFSKESKQVLLETLMNGDGDESRRRYNTVSESLRDDVLRLSLELGYQPRYSVKQYDDKHDKYLVFPRKTQNIVQSSSPELVDSGCDGVYCVSVKDNHTLLAGRNGKFQFVGQSIYGVLGFANKDSSFRLFDWRIAEAITLCGRKMIEYSANYVLDYLESHGYEDSYVALGDTDGCGISVPSAATRHEALDIVEDAVEKLNGVGYDEFFHEQMGVQPQQHHGEIEVESYAPRVFIPARNPPHGEVGVKKRRIEWQTWDEDDGEIDTISITGLEAERSDVAPITKHAQQLFAETLRMDETDAREWLFPKLRELHTSIGDGTIALDRICKRGGLGQQLSEYGSANRRAGPLYRGAKYVNDHIDGVTIQHGDKPMVVYIDAVPDGYRSTYDTHTAEDGNRVDAVSVFDPAQIPDGFAINYEKHRQKTLIEPLTPLLETRFGGEVWDDIIYNHTQEGLDVFA